MALLALLAAGIPLFSWAAFRDQTMLPRLAATAWLAGAALIALSVAGAWPAVAWRALAWPYALLAVLVALAAAATAAGVDPVASLLGEDRRYQGLLPLCMYAALMVAVTAATVHGGTVRPLLAGLLAGGALSAAYGIIQRAGLDWVNWAGLPPGRIGGAFAQPDVLGVELVSAAAASAGLLGAGDRRVRAIAGVGIALMLAALALTLSRGAWFGAAAAAGILLALNFRRLPPWRSLWYVPLAVALMAGAAVATPPARAVLSRVRSTGDFGDVAIEQRVGLWRTSVEMAGDRPLLGAGPDAFSVLFPAYRTPDQPGIGTGNVRPESAHNFFLDQWVGLGSAGLVVVVSLIGACVLTGVRVLPALDPARRAAMTGMIAALGGYYAAVSFSFAEAATGWLPWLLMGAMLGVAVTAASEPTAPRPPGTAWRGSAARIAWACAGVILVAGGVALAVADYAAGRAARLAQDGDVAAAARSARTATRWNPLEPQYLLALGFYEEAAGVRVGPEHQERAVSAYHRLNTRFEPTAVGLVREAQARANVAFTTPGDKQAVFSLLEQAAQLDPFNEELRRGIAEFYVTLGEEARARPHQDWLETLPEPTPEAAP